MPDEDFNPYEGSAGLKTDFIGEITDESEFGTDPGYMNGQATIAILNVRDDADGEDEIKWYSMGDGWEANPKDPKEAVREDGGDQKPFQRQSNWQIFLDYAYKACIAEGLDLRERGLPWDMNAQIGLKYEFGEHKYKKMSDGDDEITGSLVVPKKFLGVAGEAKKSSKAAKSTTAKKSTTKAAPTAAEKAAAAKAKAAAAKAAKATDDDEDPQLTALIALAVAADSHDEFMQSAYEELEDADAYEDKIIDEEWYEAQG